MWPVGGIIDETALYQAIVAQKVAGAALDVYEKNLKQRAHYLICRR